MRNILLTIIMLLPVVNTSLSAGDFDDLKKSCDAGDATSCSNVGIVYEYGKGVKQDYSEALKYYKISCV
jgi:hypothetical protein